MALAIAWIGGTLWFGRELLDRIARSTGNFFNCEAIFQPLKWTGASAYTEQVTLTGRPGSAIREMSARQLRAELNWRAAFDGVWRIEDLTIAQFDGDFIVPEKSGRELPQNDSLPTGLTAMLPRRSELAQIKVASANISFGKTRAAGMRLLVTRNGEGWTIDGNGGTIAIPSLPDLRISTFRARAQAGEFFLTDSALRLGTSGKINFTGESGTDRFLRTSWEDVNSKDVVDAKTQRYLDGKLWGSAEFRPPGAVRGKIQLRDGRVENVPLLMTVADFTGNPSFRRMPIQEMSADFTCENGMLKFTNFIGESKGLLHVEGNGQRSGAGQIEGHFQIGVTPQTLRWLPGSRERVFTISRDGYLWTDVVIGGTVENPTENLSPRLIAAMGGAIIEQGTNLIKDPVKAIDGAKEILNKDPAKTIDGAKGLLNNIIGPLMP